MIVAPSFGDIFATNSTQIGLLTIALPDEQLDGLKAASEATVDLEAQTIAPTAAHRSPSTSIHSGGTSC